MRYLCDVATVGLDLAEERKGRKSLLPGDLDGLDAGSVGQKYQTNGFAKMTSQ